MIKRIVTALVLSALGVTLATGASGSGCSSSQGGAHRAPKAASTHKQQPAPIPDTPPAARKSFPAKIEIVMVWTQTISRTVALFDYGQGKLHQTGKSPGGSWTARVEPGQYVYGLITPAYPGERGHLTLKIYQRSSGTIICHDDNAEAGNMGSVDCGGTAQI